MSKWVSRMDEIQGYQPASRGPVEAAPQEPYVPKPLGVLRDAEHGFGTDSLMLAMLATAWKDIRMPRPTICMNCDDDPFYDPAFSVRVVRGHQVLSFLREHSVDECAQRFVQRTQAYIESEGPSGAIARAMMEE